MEAVAQCKKVEKLKPEFNPWMEASMAYIYAKAGKIKRAEETLDKLINISTQRYIDKFNFAVICSGLGDKERAFKFLNKAYEERSTLMFFLKMNEHNWFESLSSDPRYKALLKKMNFPEK